MEKVKYHASGTLVLPNGEFDRTLLLFYDMEYPLKIFRDNFKLWGGFCEGDDSPLQTLEREFVEEIKEDTKNQNSERKYARESIMKKFREDVISTAKGIEDFHISVKKGSATKEDFNCLVSIYSSPIDSSLFNEVSDILSKDRQLNNEGLARVVSIDELKKGG
ncbi:MAG: hypothetical protein ABIA78_02420 [archaeon]